MVTGRGSKAGREFRWGRIWVEGKCGGAAGICGTAAGKCGGSGGGGWHGHGTAVGPVPIPACLLRGGNAERDRGRSGAAGRCWGTCGAAGRCWGSCGNKFIGRVAGIFLPLGATTTLWTHSSLKYKNKHKSDVLWPSIMTFEVILIKMKYLRIHISFYQINS